MILHRRRRSRLIQRGVGEVFPCNTSNPLGVVLRLRLRRAGYTQRHKSRRVRARGLHDSVGRVP